jgi:putative ABC transport system permease protein
MRAQRLRSSLIVAQIALSLVLLIGAGLTLRSFAALQAASPGIEPTGVVAASLALPGARYADERTRRQFVRRVIDRLEATPGIEGAATVTPLPLSLSGWQTSFHVEGFSEPEVGSFPTNDIARITPHYFRTMGVRLLRGRAFTWADNENAPPVAIIDETFARTWFANVDPIGKRIKINAGHPVPGMPPPPWQTVVGVVNHVKNYGIDQESRVEVYVPYMQSTLTSMTLVVRGPADAATMGQAMRQAVREADPGLPVYGVRTMEEYLARTLTPKRLMMLVLALFAGVALTLAAVGIYGVMSYAVAQRTSEIGIRLALGANPRDVLRLVVGQGMALTVAGVAIGLGAAYWLTRLIATLLFGVSATDGATFAGVAALLAVVAFLSTWIPARRAARVDPLIALRYE